MDKSSKSDALKVKVSTLKAINEPVSSYLQRADSLLKDHYSGLFELKGDLLISLLEMRLSAQILNERISELEEQSIEADVSEVHLSAQEIQLIATLAHSLEMAVISNIGNVSLRVH
jgi:hypothetical protein